MRVSAIILTVLTIIGMCFAFTGICFAADENSSGQDAISAKLFTEGKIWRRIVTAPLNEPLGGIRVRRKHRMVTATYRVVSGYSEKSPMPEEIVIEVDHPGIPGDFNPYMVILSPEGSFLGYRIYGYEKPNTARIDHGYKAMTGTDHHYMVKDNKWHDYHMSRSGYNKRIHTERNPWLSIYYVSLPLPILWKNSSFEINKDYIKIPPTEIETRVEDDRLIVTCRMFRYTHLMVNEKPFKQKIQEIQMVFKKGEPWATSLKSMKISDLRLSMPED